MIQILQETTVWQDCNPHNGIYHINASEQLVAYENQFGLTRYSIPRKGFSKSKRTFVKLGQYEDADVKLSATAVIVHGSKGQEYIVDNGTCTCPGFKFRRSCKHV
jgi:hypothetical protein|tara:strand:+ start:54012 stop:54326 length:315 start_codon:yes stop_codon:yes gene_type:complete